MTADQMSDVEAEKERHVTLCIYYGEYAKA